MSRVSAGSCKASRQPDHYSMADALSWADETKPIELQSSHKFKAAVVAPVKQGPRLPFLSLPS